jgi:hypothetical protein
MLSSCNYKFQYISEDTTNFNTLLELEAVECNASLTSRRAKMMVVLMTR